jgi:hypothetical protein
LAENTTGILEPARKQIYDRQMDPTFDCTAHNEQKLAGLLFRNDHDFGRLRSLSTTETEIIPMSNQNQNDPGEQVQNEGSKPDLQKKGSDQLTRQKEKEQEEKLKQGGDDEIKITTNNTLY